MKPTTRGEVLDLIDASFVSTALGAAMELGLFWLLAAQPLDEKGVADALGIPRLRCHYWLQLLSRLGLIEHGSRGYEPSVTARTAILEAYSQESWALLAEEARDRLPGLCDLPVHMREAGSAWQSLGLKPPMYLDQMAEDANRARRFTRMLYELHQPLAAQLVAFLDLRGVNRLMDLGGGSGVISLALLRKYPRLTSTVVDIPNVCAAGREIAAENSLADRIDYYPADFLRDELPSGFDVVLECDVNLYNETLFHKVQGSLNPAGRFVIVDQLAPATGVAPPSRVHWAFAGSLMDPEFTFPTAALIRGWLKRAGFRGSSAESLLSPPGAGTRFTDELTVIEAFK